jgi:hypothetical protein
MPLVPFLMCFACVIRSFEPATTRDQGFPKNR